jgi:polar amino acid transport system substrate-binding protein
MNYQLVKKTSRLEVELAKTPLRIRGSHQKLEQVAINLLQNASDALTNPQQGLRIATIRDECVAVLTIRDEGRGIPAGDLDKITDPFFTTRRDQDGTGLGLAISMGIVNDHKGQMTFESELGKGTCVTLKLPLWVESPPAHEYASGGL